MNLGIAIDSACVYFATKRHHSASKPRHDRSEPPAVAGGLIRRVVAPKTFVLIMFIRPLPQAVLTCALVVESRFNFAGKVDLFASRPLQSEKIDL
jgi:hypothetical protein